MYHPPCILLVDDEPDLSGITKEYLEAKGFVVVMEHNAVAALKTFKITTFDICVLDVKMPFKDGFSLAEDIRELNENVPFIFLTGQSDKEDRIRGLTLGADDYVIKPFSMQELYLRIQVVLKRMGNQRRAQLTTFTLGHFVFDAIGRTLTIEESKTHLSEMESQLLQLFCTEKNGLVSRERALRDIWQDDIQSKTRSLNVYISKLRHKLSADARVDIINIHGTGYRMVIHDTK